MKHVYKAIILIFIFAGSLYYFGSNMEEAVFSIEKSAMDMSETTLPYIAFRVDEKDYNLLHGYSTNLETKIIRESITPLTSEQAFSVLITENENEVKKLKYEILNATDESVVEENSISVLDKEKNLKIARVKIKATLEKDTEYIAKITLITAESKRIYYYTRIKVLDNGHIAEKINFVDMFHNKTLKKDAVEELSTYLETKNDADTSTFANVNIYSSLDMISYGTLNPTVVFSQVPTITEISEDQASVMLSFVISVESDSGIEYYNVKESFRFGYTPGRIYLYNYNRTMESVFDFSLTSLSKSQFKLGITNNKDIEFVTNSDSSIVAFVRNRELYSYSLSENKLVRVFSFTQENTDYIRDTFDDHDVRIVNMDDAGNLSFIVFGYMNRGEYEGRVAIILYTYDRVQGRIEERMYIPINTTFEVLKEEIGDFAYHNDLDVFYFSIYNTIYSYNLTTETLKVIAENVAKEKLIFSREKKYIAWQEENEEEEKARIHMLYLEEGDEVFIEADNNECLQLVGMVDENIIYGLYKNSDLVKKSDGSDYIPMYRIIIMDNQRNVLKEYEKDDIYITNALVKDNVIELDRVRKSSDSSLGYQLTESDFILNRANTESANFNVTKRVTEKMLTEYYISLTQDYVMQSIPDYGDTQNTVISEDKTVRINQPESYNNLYFAYSYGSIILMSEQPGEAVLAADSSVGVVIDRNGKKVWERGIKGTRAQIEGLDDVPLSSQLSSVQASLKLLLASKNVSADTSSYSKNKLTINDYLSKYLNTSPLSLKDITLDEALYYVYKGAPVIVLQDAGNAVVITGYDSMNVTIIDPSQYKTIKMGIKEATEKFDKQGNTFISYYE